MSQVTHPAARLRRRPCVLLSGLAALLLLAALLPVVAALAASPGASGGPAVVAADPVDAVGSVDATAAADRAEEARRVSALWREGRLDEALAACDAYLERHPGDAAMHYNRACLLARDGRTDPAWEAYLRAVELGHDDFVGAAADPDLADLTSRPRFAELRQQRLAELGRQSWERGVTLEAGVWSEPLPLLPALGETSEPAGGEVRLRFNQGGLELRATVPDPHFRAAPPWQGGSGLFVVVGAAPEPGTAQLAGSIVAALGMAGRLPAGAVLLDEGPEARWQQVSELVPKIRPLHGDMLEITAGIPWEVVHPVHPLLDRSIGLNLVHRTATAGGAPVVTALLPDAGAHLPDRTRRGVPVELEQGPGSQPGLVGRVRDPVVGSDPVTVLLAAWVPTSGRGALELAVRDAGGRSVLSAGPGRTVVDLEAGAHTWEPQILMADLPTGPFVVSAQLKLPDGTDLTWSTVLLRMQEGWLERARERMQEAVESPERPFVEYRLRAIAEALAELGPGDDPGAVATTVVETGLMLRRAETTGSVLPDGGDLMAVHDDATGERRLAAIHLPAGYRRGESRAPVLLVLADAPSAAQALVHGVAQHLPDTAQVVVVAPAGRAPAEGGGAAPAPAPAGQEADDARAVLEWARSFFATERLLLAGVDAGAATALELSLERPADLGPVLLLAGRDFAHEASGGRADPARLERAAAAAASGAGTAPTVSWILFPGDAGRTDGIRAVHTALRSAGLTSEVVARVPGGLSLSQATGRIALWAVPLVGP
ncbi:MAG: tetratricopeptide repeat protein [Candidatus Krumholzibacteriia bacterium]